MLDDRYKKIFAENLKHYMKLHDKNQADLINDLGFNKSSVSTWCNGTRLPRMDKVDILAKYFDINRSDLIEDKTTEKNQSYYLNPETSRCPTCQIKLESVPSGITYHKSSGNSDIRRFTNVRASIICSFKKSILLITICF